MDIKGCLEKGYLKREKPDKKLIDKELKESEYDFGKAKKGFEEEDYKWTIIKCYYSIFHSAKAVGFKQGYREKKHYALLVILEELNKNGKLEIKYVNNFSAAMSARENADYMYNYTKEKAEHMLNIAEEFNSRMKRLIKGIN